MLQPPSSPSHTDAILWALPFGPLEWERTPPAVQDSMKRQTQHIAPLQSQRGQCQSQLAQLQQQGETLPGRVPKTSQTSSTPPSSAAPCNQPKRRRQTSSGTRGGQKSHRGNGPMLLSPTAVHRIEPGPWPCGHGNLVALTPSSTQHGIEVPPSERAVHPCLLQQGLCQGCGRQLQAPGPRDHQAGYGPRWSALIGARAGLPRTSWRLVQAFCHAVFNIPSSLGAGQKVIQGVSQALVPHHEAIATLAHQAPVGDMDATPWYGQNAWPWLWLMAPDQVAYSRLEPHRSQAAFVALIEDWQGLVVSAGDGVEQDWGPQRHTCRAHLIRRARGWSQRRAPDIAACGHTALKALQRLGHMAHEPPSGGPWQAW